VVLYGRVSPGAEEPKAEFTSPIERCVLEQRGTFSSGEASNLEERNLVMRNLGLGFIAVVALLSLADRARGMGEILGQTKEELKLKYEVVVHDLTGGRVTVEFTLADEGRLKPLDGVELMVPAREKDASGGYSMDLMVPVEVKSGKDGKRVARVQLTRELAERAEIWLTTYWFDGKQLVMTRYHHVIPVAKYLKR
jgi:hypothetical protein